MTMFGIDPNWQLRLPGWAHMDPAPLQRQKALTRTRRDIMERGSCIELLEWEFGRREYTPEEWEWARDKCRPIG
jgi:hypothetical protein